VDRSTLAAPKALRHDLSNERNMNWPPGTRRAKGMRPFNSSERRSTLREADFNAASRPSRERGTFPPTLRPTFEVSVARLRHFLVCHLVI
jgi:hypothetical protein